VQEGRLFGRAVPQILVEENATREKILAGLEWLTNQHPEEKDYVVLFVSGHGDVEGQKYYFAPRECDRENLASTGVSWDEVKERLKNLPAKVILMLDTCHAAQGGVQLADTLNALLREAKAETGVIVYAACQPNEQSAESSGHGLFTQALLEAFSGMAEISRRSDRLSVDDLARHLRKTVTERSGGKQHPSTKRIGGLTGNLPLALFSSRDRSGRLPPPTMSLPQEPHGASPASEELATSQPRRGEIAKLRS
jgi:uncharacterized caspase-like protein